VVWWLGQWIEYRLEGFEGSAETQSGSRGRGEIGEVYEVGLAIEFEQVGGKSDTTEKVFSVMGVGWYSYNRNRWKV
jgi:hypothetical protein